MPIDGGSGGVGAHARLQQPSATRCGVRSDGSDCSDGKIEDENRRERSDGNFSSSMQQRRRRRRRRRRQRRRRDVAYGRRAPAQCDAITIVVDEGDRRASSIVRFELSCARSRPLQHKKA